MLNPTLHTHFEIHTIYHVLTHPFPIKLVGAGIQKHADNLNMIGTYCGVQGSLVELFWRVFRYEGDQRIVMVLTGAYRHDHETMSDNAVVDSHI